MKKITNILSICLLMVLTLEVKAWACSACFTAVNSPNMTALKWGVISLLLVLLVVLLSLAWFFIGVMKRSKQGVI